MAYEQICNWYNVCPFKIFYEEDKIDKKWIDEYCWGDYFKCVRRKMEKEGVFHPDNMLPDGTIREDIK